MATGDDLDEIDARVETTSPDLGLVDALARLQLAARRRGCLIQFQPSQELRELLLLVGLAEVLCGEPRRQAKERIELGIQEVVQPDDPSV